MKQKKEQRWIKFYKRGEAINRAKKQREEKEFKSINPVVCKMFGCGKHLSPTEYLCSEYCFKHAQEVKQKGI